MSDQNQTMLVIAGPLVEPLFMYLHWQPRIVVVPNLSSLVARDNAVTTATGDKIGIMRTPVVHSSRLGVEAYGIWSYFVLAFKIYLTSTIYLKQTRWAFVITRSNVTRYCTEHDDDKSRGSVKVWIQYSENTPHSEVWGVFCEYLGSLWPNYLNCSKKNNICNYIHITVLQVIAHPCPIL